VVASTASTAQARKTAMKSALAAPLMTVLRVTFDRDDLVIVTAVTSSK
jgi:hypothetical protein